jgi:hypothetical protein
MHNKQIEAALFPKDKIIADMQKEVYDLHDALNDLRVRNLKIEMYANRYIELRAIGVLIVEEGSDPKYLKGEDMDAYFQAVGPNIVNLLAGSMQSLKDQIDEQVLRKLYDTRSQGQSKRDENT